MDNTPGEEGESAIYLSYLLRLWREGRDEERWQASLHDPRTGERLGFGSVDELFAFLQGQMGTARDSEAARGRTRGSSEGRR